MPAASAESTKDRLVAAAFALFRERGFEGTTADDIAQRAGVGRTTFFRTFRSKEDVIFPAHEVLLQQIESRLATATVQTRSIALTEAAALVLRHYLDEGDLARARYRLVSTVAALRAREVAGIQQYQRLFARFLTAWLPDDDGGRLRADLVASAVVTAHNHVLRRWLRGETDTPVADFDRAMTSALAPFEGAPTTRRTGSGGGTSVVVLRTSTSVEDVLARLQPLLDDPETTTPARPPAG